MAPRTISKDRAAEVADRYIKPKDAKGKPASAPDPPKPGEDTDPKPAGSPIPWPPPKTPALPELNNKQALFVQEYLVDWNATAAAIRAGYSAKTAGQIGFNLLKKVEIRAAIEIAKRDQIERIGFNADALLKILIGDVNADIGDIFDEHENLRPVKDWPPAFRKGLIAGLEVEELYAGTGEDRVKVGVVKKLKLADRTGLKKLLGNHVAIQAFKEKRELGIPEGSPLAVLAEQLKGTALRPKDISGTARDVTPAAAPNVLRPRE